MPESRPGWEPVLTGAAAVFGLTVSAGVLAVVVAGLLQWGPSLPPVLDDGLPLAVLALGLLLAGRVAADVAGRRGPWAGVGAALLVLVIGVLLSRVSEAHGDGLEVLQVVLAAAVVLVLTGGSAWWTEHRRHRRTRKPEQG